jgi:hypothetical protein
VGRTTSRVKGNLANLIEPDCVTASLLKRDGIGSTQVPYATEGGVQVLNLCEDEEVIVESPEDAFPPLVVHYAETFIVPAAIGSYRIRLADLQMARDAAPSKRLSALIHSK